MNGEALRAGLTTSEGQLAGVLTALLTLHDKLGLTLDAITMESLTALGVAYIIGRTVLKVSALFLARRAAPAEGGE